MCGEDTGSSPRHNITLPPCLLRITGLGGQKQLNDSMAKVMGNLGGKGLGKAPSVILLRTAWPTIAGSARILELGRSLQGPGSKFYVETTQMSICLGS